jgi:hypothetical protein
MKQFFGKILKLSRKCFIKRLLVQFIFCGCQEQPMSGTEASGAGNQETLLAEVKSSF